MLNVSSGILLTDQISFWLLLLREILDDMCIIFICSPDCDVIKLEINLIFLIKPFFLHDLKHKTLNILTTKRAFKMNYKNKKYFLSFLKGLH